MRKGKDMPQGYKIHISLQDFQLLKELGIPYNERDFRVWGRTEHGKEFDTLTTLKYETDDFTVIYSEVDWDTGIELEILIQHKASNRVHVNASEKSLWYRGQTIYGVTDFGCLVSSAIITNKVTEKEYKMLREMYLLFFPES